ncbi:hypothetical protein SMA5143A_0949 [Streptomyces sp. MA5143a]|nr:hypothetical protein SMA5143A_0949 [Streptomyces sp. MA5143a]
MDYAIVFHIQDGQITEAWALWSDTRTYDEFWS